MPLRSLSTLPDFPAALRPEHKPLPQDVLVALAWGKEPLPTEPPALVALNAREDWPKPPSLDTRGGVTSLIKRRSLAACFFRLVRAWVRLAFFGSAAVARKCWRSVAMPWLVFPLLIAGVAVVIAAVVIMLHASAEAAWLGRVAR